MGEGARARLTGAIDGGYLSARLTCGVPTIHEQDTQAPDSAETGEANELRSSLPRWVVFGCDGRRYAVPLERLRGIVAAQSFTRLPGCSEEVAGLIGLRGRVVTVFDLGVILASRPARSLPDYRLFLVERDDELVGCIVDEVIAVAVVQPRPPAREEERLAGVDLEGPHIAGIGAYDGHPFIAVNLDALLEGLLARRAVGSSP